MSEWLLDSLVLDEMRAASDAGNFPSAAEQAEYEARDRSDSGILTVAGDKAQVNISGVLTPRPDLFARWFGGGNTTYPEIIQALADAEQDPTVSAITLAIDSPGGTIAGLFDTLAALESVEKPMRAVVGNIAASAAYAIASQAGEIVATNVAASVGSIGIVTTVFVREDQISVTSTKAPLKNPDARTAEGRAAIRDRLDALHEIFVDAIAAGRNMTADKVNADFGRGATVLAEEAQRRGMIDGVTGVNHEAAAADGDDRKTEANRMDIVTLKAEHPEVYAEVLQVGNDAGVKAERDRVGAHLLMGETSGDTKTAFAAIRDGEDMTATLQATYMAAGINRKNQADRLADDEDANAGDGATDPTDGDMSDQVTDAVGEKLGSEE